MKESGAFHWVVITSGNTATDPAKYPTIPGCVGFGNSEARGRSITAIVPFHCQARLSCD